MSEGDLGGGTFAAGDARHLGGGDTLEAGHSREPVVGDLQEGVVQHVAELGARQVVEPAVSLDIPAFEARLISPAAAGADHTVAGLPSGDATALVVRGSRRRCVPDEVVDLADGKILEQRREHQLSPVAARVRQPVRLTLVVEALQALGQRQLLPQAEGLAAVVLGVDIPAFSGAALDIGDDLGHLPWAGTGEYAPVDTHPHECGEIILLVELEGIEGGAGIDRDQTVVVEPAQHLDVQIQRRRQWAMRPLGRENEAVIAVAVAIEGEQGHRGGEAEAAQRTLDEERHFELGCVAVDDGLAAGVL